MRALVLSLGMVLVPALGYGQQTAVRQQPATSGTPGSRICNQLAGSPEGMRGVSGATLPAKTLGVFDVCFDGIQWQVQPPPNARITNKDAVWIRVRHFNFLHFTLSYDIKEEKSDSYQYLTRLWSSILSPQLGDLIGALSVGDKRDILPQFLNLVVAVYAKGQEVQRQVDVVLHTYANPGLTASEARDLAASAAAISTARTDLQKAFRALQDAVEGKNCPTTAGTTVQTPDSRCFELAFGTGGARYYQLGVETYNLASSKADSFLALADRTIHDEIKKLGTKNGGMRVTITLTAIDAQGSKKDFEEIHYTVQTSMPLVAHGGLAFSGIKDVSFDTVKRASQFSENDFFAQRGTGDTSKGYSAFLAWQFYGAGSSTDTDAKSHPLGLLLSLGTDVTSPGKRLFVGPSVMAFGRVVLTAGEALGSESHGQDEIEPNVFRIIADRPKTSWFTAITMRVY